MASGQFGFVLSVWIWFFVLPSLCIRMWARMTVGIHDCDSGRSKDVRAQGVRLSAPTGQPIPGRHTSIYRLLSHVKYVCMCNRSIFQKIWRSARLQLSWILSPNARSPVLNELNWNVQIILRVYMSLITSLRWSLISPSRYCTVCISLLVCMCVLMCLLVRTVIGFTQASHVHTHIPVTPLTYDDVILGGNNVGPD